MTKKLISFILVLILVAAPLFGGAGRVSAVSQDTYAVLEAAVDKQIRAFADSIDKSNADDSAAAALAKHGMTGSGKTLKVGKSHALTATLFNSKLLQTGLVGACVAAIEYMQTFHLESMLHITGEAAW